MLTKTKHELTFFPYPAFCIILVKIPYIHGKRIHIVVRVSGHIDDRAAIGCRNIKVFVHGVYNYDFIIGRKKHLPHCSLTEEGFTGTRHTEYKPISIDKLLSVSNIDILTYLIDTIIYTTLIIQLLHIKWHKHRKGLCEHGSHGFHLSYSNRKCCIECFPLFQIMHINGTIVHSVLPPFLKFSP